MKEREEKYLQKIDDNVHSLQEYAKKLKNKVEVMNKKVKAKHF